MNIKQFFTLLKQQRFFSGIYIVCTALSTALTMTLFLVIYIIVGPIYPEQERSRMAVVQLVHYDIAGNEDGQIVTGHVNTNLADSLRKMPEVELLTAIQRGKPKTVKDSNGRKLTCMVSLVDDAFWQVYNFRFVHGHPFTREEWEAQSPVCVISEDLAHRVFGKTDVVGQTLDIGGYSEFGHNGAKEQLRIVGVVKEVSKAMALTHAQVWKPRKVRDWMIPEMMFYGQNTLVMLLHKGKTVKQLQERMTQLEERANLQAEANGFKYRLNMHGQPQPHWQSGFITDATGNWKPILRKILAMLLAFMLIPAMNMSSMVASRINARISEMGIRRAYGAGRATLLWQVLQENFVLTFLGSLVGLAISWLIVALGADWLPFIFNINARYYAGLVKSSVNIQGDMLLSSWVLAAVMVATLALNLISALVPAMWSLRKSVTEEINSKR